MKVRVTPKSSRNSVEVGDDGRIKVYVTAPPAEGQANRAVIEALASALGVPKSSLSIVQGHAWRDKTIDLAALTAEEAVRRLSGS